MIFFSAHGVPVSYVEEAGDPYKDQMEDCISLIMRELKLRGVENSHVLAYQVNVSCQYFFSCDGHLISYSRSNQAKIGEVVIKHIAQNDQRYNLKSN